MIVKTLFKYTGKNGTVITPVDLSIPCSEMKRLIAEPGKELINGKQRCFCVDVTPADASAWSEVDALSEKEGA